MEGIRNWFQVVMQFIVLVIASAQNGTTSTSTTTATITPTPFTITPSPETPQTTPDPETTTLSSSMPPTLGLAISLGIVGLLAITFLLFFLFREVFLRVRKPDEGIDTDEEEKSVRLSTYRLSRGFDIDVSPVEIFCQEEEFGSVEKKDPFVTTVDEVPSQDMHDKDVGQVAETKVADDIVSNQYEDTALPMEKKSRKDISTPDPVYINGDLPTGRKMSNPTLLLGDSGMMNIQMPSLPQGNIEIRAKENKPTENCDPTDQAANQEEPIEEYAYVDNRLNDGSGHDDDDDSVQSDYNYPEFPMKIEDDYATVESDIDSDNSHDYEQTDSTVVRKPTTNHYKNEKMFNAKGRKAQIK